MSIENGHIVEAARRFSLACNCASNIVPCTKCWNAAEACVDGHQHEAATRRYTHNVQDHGFDRCVETCACGAQRVLTRECGESKPAHTNWVA